MKENKTNKEVRSKDIIRQAATYSGLTIETVKKCYSGILCAISENVDNDNTVILDNFCKFNPRIVKEHDVIAFGKKVHVDERKKVSFKAYANFNSFYIR